MRSASRFRQKVWFSRKTERQEGIDIIEVYENPVMKRLDVSVGSGDPMEMGAGIVPDYDRTIVSHDKKFEPLEGDVLWVDREPELNEEGGLVAGGDGITPSVLPDYILKRIERSQKSLTVKYRIVKIGGNR